MKKVLGMMKKWTGGVLIAALALIFIITYFFIGKSESSSNSNKHSAYDFFNPHSIKEEDSSSSSDSDPNSNATDDDLPQAEEVRHTTVAIPKPHFITLHGLNNLYILSKNLTRQDSTNAALLTWSQMKFLFPRSDALPETARGIKEAVIVFKHLLRMIAKDNAFKLGHDPLTEIVCPHFVTASSNTTLLSSFLEIPCGLVEGSSITVIGIPDSHQDTFQIELIGSQLKELNPPIVLQYNVLLPGENLTKEAVTTQNTWSQEFGWGKEEKCPDHAAPLDLVKVDGLVKCNTQMVRITAENTLNASHPANRKLTNVSEGSIHTRATFHFVEGNPFTATLWAGDQGFHMTLNGRHETSFVYRNGLEPWLVNRVNVKGGLTIVSILAKGLHATEDLDLVVDAQQLKAASLITNKRLIMLIGVFSSGNNFERRMAIRRTWMQFDDVRSGDVAVRFFIGLHKNKEVNYKLWREAQAYGDIQLMPFVDYYSMLTYKTIAICIMGTKILPAKYIMKMDDDAFVRIDEVLSSLKEKASSSNGLLFGQISFDSSPNRDNDNKWFISDEEWPHSTYPPWAHGPGYVISQDVARFIVEGHKQRDLMLFKLEDVAVGIWIEEYRKRGRKIEYMNNDRFYNAGCEAEYILAHYQNPRLMLCLWENLNKQHKPDCCD
ncbi:hypothetical protein ABFS83_14G001600 [Erythranthe nasuta]